MISTRKVASLTASLLAVDSLLAGISYAASVEGGDMSETLAIMSTLVVIQAGLLILVIRIGLNLLRKSNTDPLDNILGGQLESDTDLKSLLTQIAAKVSRQDEALGKLLEDFHLRKAEEKAGDLTPL